VKENYLLIDLENVQPGSLALLNGHPFKVIVFLGASQTKVPLDLAQSLQPFGEKVQYVQISGTGRNALDFHIAFTLGELTLADQTASYHILSRDTGFDPLIKHLKTKGIRARRVQEIGEIPLLRVATCKTIPEKIEAVVSYLKSRGSSLPRKVQTLTNTINHLFAKSLNTSELAEILQSLARNGYIKIESETVSYQLPGRG
jgi:hypothetical protein